MALNIIKTNLSRLLVLFVVIAGCKNKAVTSSNTTSTISKGRPDTCKLNSGKAKELGSEISCISCHTMSDQRILVNLPTMNELSLMDSLKLSDFLYVKKHNKSLAIYKDHPITILRLKKIDSLSECDRQNLIHYIKEYSRPHVYQ